MLAEKAAGAKENHGGFSPCLAGRESVYFRTL